MEFVYDENKYCVSNFLGDEKLLNRHIWYSLGESRTHEYKELRVDKVKGDTVLCSYRVYDRNIKDFVDMPMEYPIQDICLYKYMAVNLEFDKVMNSLEPEMAEFIRSLVESKEDTARCDGYNGCI